MKEKTIEKRVGGDGDDDGDVAPDERYPRYQTLFTALSLFYLFVGLLMIICAWILVHNATIGGSIVFTLLAVILLTGAVLQLVYRVQMVNSVCGACPLPRIGNDD